MLQYQRGADTPKGSKTGLGSSEILSLLRQLPAEEKLVRFFEREGNYEVYGDAAVLVAGILFKNANLGVADGVPVLTVTPAQFGTAVKELLADGKVEVWAFNAVRRSWKMAVRASPGNYEQLEQVLSADDTLEMSAPIIGAIYVRGTQVGLVTVDTTRFLIGWTSFLDSDLWTNLEAALVQLDAKECVYLRGADVGGLFATGSCVGTELIASEFENCSIRDDLARLLVPGAILPELPTEVEKALSGLFRYLGLLASDGNLSVYRLEALNLSQYMRLDETALQALNIFGKGSLYEILNQCKTRQGSALLAQWLRQPLLEIDGIRRRADIVEALVNGALQRQSLRETVLRGIPDVSRIGRRLLRGKASLQDLVLLYSAVAKIYPVHEQLVELSGESMELMLLEPLRRLSAGLAKYAELIEKTVDFAALNRHEYIVRADFAESLTGIHEQKEAILDAIEQEYDRAARRLSLEKGKKIKLERNGTYGYFFRISRLDGGVLTDEYQELAALKNGLYFVSPTLRELSVKYDELSREYSTAQSVLVKEMLEVAKTYRRQFDELNCVIATVDVLQALAYAAVVAPLPLVRPQMLPMGTEAEAATAAMDLTDARHVCVEAASTSPFIANNVAFARDTSFQIITGPNMGGKSTYIRQTAMIALLAQIGAFVPCASARLPVFDALLVRVGAGDSILRGMSTFMMEMLETASILKMATDRSLVIIDELGRGTSTSEGLGLAWGVAKVLAQRGCFAFFATHFHEITELAKTLPNVRNLHAGAEIVQEKLLMTYRVTEGVCDRSYGVQVAKMAGFPRVVIDMAQIMLKDLEGEGFTEEQAAEGLEWCSEESMGLCFDNEEVPSFIREAAPSLSVA